jgi:transposase
MMKTNSDTTPKLYIGLDVHKEQTSVAIADPGARGEVRSHGNISTTLPSIDKTLRRIAKSKNLDLSELHICYEAGGGGMWIARLLRAGELTAVHVPDEIDEAIRDLCRARVDAVDDLRRAKTRLLALFRRLGHHYSQKTTWTEAHKRYIRELSLAYPAHDIIREEFIQQIDQLEQRIARLEDHMELLCATWSRKPIVDAIMALRGFKIIASMLVVSEIGDFVRFTHPKQLMNH